jgi:hypothetical protein
MGPERYEPAVKTMETRKREVPLRLCVSADRAGS